MNSVNVDPTIGIKNKSKNEADKNLNKESENPVIKKRPENLENSVTPKNSSKYSKGLIEEKKNNSDINNYVPEVNADTRRGKSSTQNLNKSKSRSTNNISLSKKSKRGVIWRERNLIEIVNVESYRKYNADMSYNESNSVQNTRCNCIII